VDCSQFSDDFDILRQLPFPITINPNSSYYYEISTVHLNDDQTFVKSFTILNENVVPSSIYCLSNLDLLHIEGTPFENGIVSDDLENLKTLDTFLIYDSPVKKMTNKLGTLTNLKTIQFINCSLTYLPDLSNLQKLELLDAPHNNLSRLDGLPGVKILDLDINCLTEIPVTNNPENLEFLGISYNPLESASHITLYKNLQMLYIKFATLTKIPRDIDRLQKLEVLHIAGNNLTHLPTNLLNLPQLEFLNATKNLLSFDEIVGIKKLFKKSHPKTELFI